MIEHILDMCKDIGSTLSTTKIKLKMLFKENKENYVCKLIFYTSAMVCYDFQLSLSYYFLLSVETVSHSVVQAGLELTMQSKLTLKSQQSSCHSAQALQLQVSHQAQPVCFILIYKIYFYVFEHFA